MTMLDGSRATGRAGARRARQVEALEAWALLRAQREAVWHAVAPSREDRMEANRRLDVLARADTALRAHAEDIAARTAGEGPTAVVAHRHEWFADKVCTALEDRGFLVVAPGVNGPDVLGVVVAEQPDVVLLGDTLATLTVEELLADAALLAPAAVLSVHVVRGDQVGRVLDAGARTAFTGQVPPADVAASLASLVGAGSRRT